MNSLQINLPEFLQPIIDRRVREGHYRDPDDYVRQLILNDQKRGDDLAVESRLLEGLDSGDPLPVTAEYWRGLRQRMDERIRRRTQR